MSTWSRALAVIRHGVAARVFPGACVEVGSAEAARWRQAVGSLSYEPDSPPVAADTVYDLASLTKPIATATVAMRLVEAGRLDLDRRPWPRIEPGWLGADRDARHRPGPARARGRAAGVGAAVEAIMPGGTPSSPPRAACPSSTCRASQSLYSDLGFIVLGAVAGAGRAAPRSTSSSIACAAPWRPAEPSGIPLRFTPPPA